MLELEFVSERISEYKYIFQHTRTYIHKLPFKFRLRGTSAQKFCRHLNFAACFEVRRISVLPFEISLKFNLSLFFISFKTFFISFKCTHWWQMMKIWNGCMCSNEIWQFTNLKLVDIPYLYTTNICCKIKYCKFRWSFRKKLSQRTTYSMSPLSPYVAVFSIRYFSYFHSVINWSCRTKFC